MQIRGERCKHGLYCDCFICGYEKEIERLKAENEQLQERIRMERNGFIIKVDLTDVEDPFRVHHAKTGRFITSYPTLEGAIYECDEGQADEKDMDAMNAGVLPQMI